MQHKSFSDMECPIALGLEQVGEWWSMLIIRDALLGSTRFHQFQKSLSIAPNMLTRRLNHLVSGGLMEKTIYQAEPLKHEYVLTDKGRAFEPVLNALYAWGEQHCPQKIQAKGQPEGQVDSELQGLPASILSAKDNHE